ncbi:MAG TPA: transposase [Pyrinomonadaceae bacterium]|nr:transposase [Pyrinomonadaceae bacterium]
MAKKDTNRNLAGVLHYVTGNVDKRRRIFRQDYNCITFLEEIQALRKKIESRLICFVVMLDHFHLIVNPRDGDIQGWIGELKSVSAKRLVEINPVGLFKKNEGENQVWQESFRTMRLWSGWMIWQKINYIHNNPLKAGLVDSASDYRWSSFRSFYHWEHEELLAVDDDWFFPEDGDRLKELQRRGELY